MTTRTPNLSDTLAQLIEDYSSNLWTMIPGKVESYDADLQKADVLPMIRRSQRVVDGSIDEELPVISQVPVAWPRAGSYRLTFPVAAGDRCVLLISSASIDAYQGSSDSRPLDPGSYQRHDLSDAVALMGWYPDPSALGTTDADDVSIGEEGGPVIHIGRDLVNLYEKDAADFVARADRVESELTSLRDTVDDLVSTFNSHVHVTTATVSQGPPGVLDKPATGATPPASVGSTACDKVKAT